MFRKYCAPLLGGRKLSDISPEQIALVLKEASKMGRSSQTRLHIYNLLHKMFGDAIEHYQYLLRSPVLRRYRPSIRKTERTFLRPYDSLKLMAHCKDDPLGPAIWIGLNAGPRPSETQVFRWASVDFYRSQLLIRAAYNRKTGLIQDYPKQGDWGAVPMTAALIEYLSKRKGKPREFVTSTTEGKMLSYTTFYKGLKRLCREACVPVITPHELRHSCTELWIDAGATEEDIRRLLNHRNTSATKTYIHRTDERLKKICDLVASPKLD